MRPSPYQPSFFVLGNPRSGTTLFRLMLTCHTQIVVPPEAGFAIWLAVNYEDWTLEDCEGDRLNEFVTSLVNSRKFITWNLSAETVSEAIESMRPANYRQLISSIYQLYAEKTDHNPKAIIGDKNNFYTRYVPQLTSLFPDASIIHLVRDGRDVAASYREIANATYSSPYAPELPRDIHEIAAEWASTTLTIEKQLTDYNTKYITIRYEDLVRNPERVLSEVCTFLHLPFDHKMLDFHHYNKRRKLEPSETLEWKEKTLSPVSSDSVGRFQTELTSSEIAQFNRVAKVALLRFNYRMQTKDT